MLSFIIPAHNEEVLLQQTLPSLFQAIAKIGDLAEVIVVDDASTDRTAEVALSYGACVLSVAFRHIAAARNAGAGVARGDVLVFVDADTWVTETLVRSAVIACREGAIGGGAVARVEGEVPLWGRAMMSLVGAWVRLVQWVPGCFLFVRRDAFEAAGGFDETYYAAEDIDLSRQLKARGRVVVLREPVVTSGRKFRVFSTSQIVLQIARVLVYQKALRQRESLGLWYGKQRPSADLPPRGSA